MILLQKSSLRTIRALEDFEVGFGSEKASPQSSQLDLTTGDLVIAIFITMLALIAVLAIITKNRGRNNSGYSEQAQETIIETLEGYEA